MADKLSCNRINWIFMLVFLATTIALAAYLIYEKVKDDDEVDWTVVDEYKGYFRTKLEQAVVANKTISVFGIEDTIDVEDINGTKYSQCDYSCPLNNEFVRPGDFPQPDENRGKRSASSGVRHLVHRALGEPITGQHTRHRRDDNVRRIYHGCCISVRKFIKPNHLPNIDGVKRKVAQFKDENQYFLTEDCRHANGCTGCTCRQEQNVVTAVVHNPEYPKESDQQYMLDFVILRGCCKCFND